MSDSPYIQDLTEDNFDAIVTQGSHDQPVLVDFWASWCQPCQMLMPVLAKLADEYQGRFILAKLNTEENQSLAGQFGIRSIPNVKLFVNGQEVDEFAGALPESSIREFLEKHLPRESDNHIEAALQTYASGDPQAAVDMLEQARQSDPENSRILLAMAQIHAASGDFEAAQAILDALPVDEQEKQEVVTLSNQLLFARGAPGDRERAEFEKRIAENENDSEARYGLAMAQAQAGDYASAIEHLLGVMARDNNYKDGAAREALLKLFDMLGDDPMVAQARRRLFNMMH